VDRNCCAPSLNTVLLDDRPYNIAIAMQETTGGEIIDVKWGFGTMGLYDDLQYIDGLSGAFFQPIDQPRILKNRSPGGITTTSAVLNAELNASGAVYRVELYWGPTDEGANYGAWSNRVSIGSFTNVSELLISQVVTGLSPEATLYYTFRATNCLEDLRGLPAQTVVTRTDFSALPFQTQFTLCGYDLPETLNDFPLLVQLGSNINGFAYSQLRPDGGDLRFSDGAGNDLLYEVDIWNTNGASWLWVQLPQLVDSNNCLFMHWGNPGLTAPFYTTNGAMWSGPWRTVLHLSETNGLHFDATTNGNHGLNLNADQDAQGVVGGANDLDGDTDWIDLSGPPRLSPTEDFTYSIWVNPDTYDNAPVNSGGGDFFIDSTTATTPLIGLKPVSDQFGFQVRYDNGSGLGGPVGGSVRTGTWQHAVMTREVGNRFQVYVDGVLAGTRVDNGLPLRPPTPRLGAHATIPQNALNGRVDEFRIASGARSSNWIWAAWFSVASNDTFICYDPTPPSNSVDLAVSKIASTNTLTFGTTVVYTITVTNLGGGFAGGVTVTDALPTGVSVLSSVPSASQTNGNRVAFDLGFLAGGGSTTIVINASVTSTVPGTIINTAMAYSTNNDIALLNNQDTASVVLPDSDGDGLANPGDPDDDNDGFDDVAEAIANTDPLDPLSFLRVRILRTGNSDVRTLFFLTAPGRTYRIESAADLDGAPWVTVRTNIPGSGLLTNIPDTNNVQRLYYRIGVETP
ncbi:MAG: LamG-like jellyroll fold domain-containing protein, partial [Verrucomicrobiota bacterium]